MVRAREIGGKSEASFRLGSGRKLGVKPNGALDASSLRPQLYKKRKAGPPAALHSSPKNSRTYCAGKGVFVQTESKVRWRSISALISTCGFKSDWIGRKQGTAKRHTFLLLRQLENTINESDIV